MNDEQLQPQVLLRAYAMGIFPMADHAGDIAWYSPDPRAVIELDRFKIPRSLRQRMRKGGYEVGIDRVFEQVIRRCADREEGTWISEDIVKAYCRLHEVGYAHSVEIFRDARLAGGLYGVSIAGLFCGESMFTIVTDSSKLALVALVEHMRKQGMTLLDIQFMTPHLARFGAREIPRSEYLKRLEQALTSAASFTANAPPGEDRPRTDWTTEDFQE